LYTPIGFPLASVGISLVKIVLSTISCILIVLQITVDEYCVVSYVLVEVPSPYA
jgi:hypothetical protein